MLLFAFNQGKPKKLSLRAVSPRFDLRGQASLLPFPGMILAYQTRGATPPPMVKVEGGFEPHAFESGFTRLCTP